MTKSIKPARKTKTLEYDKDIHTEHCCILHGCYFKQDFNCSVIKGEKPQSYICEECAHNGIINLKMLYTVQSGGKPKCPYCDHTLP